MARFAMMLARLLMMLIVCGLAFLHTLTIDQNTGAAVNHYPEIIGSHGFYKLRRMKMCTNGRAKLKEVGDELDCAYAELREIRAELAEEKTLRAVAEFDHANIQERNMLLTRRADISNFCMMTSLVVTFIVLGLFVYVL